jgi:4-hydroxy-tetrahydrodipicolinate reductase
MVNGIPGNMAVNAAKHALNDSRFELIPRSLTGPEITDSEYVLGSLTIRLTRPDMRDQVLEEIKKNEGAFITVDYTHPSAVNANAEFYCKNGLPFVMGTTGGDRKKLEDTVNASSVPAVIAPNMAKQIVGFQAMMAYAAEAFPGLFDGYALEIRESHQKGKADTSGTAKAMVQYFNKLGTPFSEDGIIKERDPEVQKNTLGIPEEYLSGHGWHTYTLISNDNTVKFQFVHNVNGRDVYAKGTLDAVAYLSRKLNQGVKGKVYSMIDVLKDI